MFYSVPPMTLLLFLGWLWLQIYFFNLRPWTAIKGLVKRRKVSDKSLNGGKNDSRSRFHAVLEKKYESLGPMKLVHQLSMSKILMIKDLEYSNFAALANYQPYSGSAHSSLFGYFAIPNSCPVGEPYSKMDTWKTPHLLCSFLWFYSSGLKRCRDLTVCQISNFAKLRKNNKTIFL